MESPGTSAGSRDSFNERMRNQLVADEREDLQEAIVTRKRWMTLATTLFSSSTVLMGLSSIFIFLGAYYSECHANLLQLIGGSLGVLSICSKEIGSYAKSRDHKLTIKINSLLKELKVKVQIPDQSRLDD